MEVSEPANSFQEVYAREMRQRNDFNVIQIRLDTEYLITQIQTYLKGEYINYVQNEVGAVVPQIINEGRPLANHRGIQGIMSLIRMVINPSVVQGYFPADKEGESWRYDFFILELNLNLLDAVIINCYDWGVEDDDINPLVNNIMLMCQPYLSRLINNLERESYSTTLRHVESNRTENQKKGWSLFKKG